MDSFQPSYIWTPDGETDKKSSEQVTKSLFAAAGLHFCTLEMND